MILLWWGGAMSERLGFGIIGVGSIAKTHYKALSESSNCRFVAAFHPDVKKAKVFCESCGEGKAYGNLDAFMSDSEIQAVLIGTPSGSHLDPALAAIEHGKHVLIEKPIEITTERVRKILDAAKKKGVVVSGIFQSRFYEASLLIKKALDEGRFGRLTLVDARVKWFRDQIYYDSGAWRGTWKLDGGGALMNQSIHAIDLLQWYAGKVCEVQAYTATLSHQRIEVEDTGAALLRFQSGAVGVIEGSTSVYPGFPKRIEICGTDGSAVLEEESITTWRFREERPEDEEIRRRFMNMAESSGGASDPKAINYKGHMLQFDDFASAILEGRSPAITGESAAEAVKIVCAIYESARTGRPAMV